MSYALSSFQVQAHPVKTVSVHVCVGVMGEVWFSFFSYVSFHASVLYTCFSMRDTELLKNNYIQKRVPCAAIGACLAWRRPRPCGA